MTEPQPTPASSAPSSPQTSASASPQPAHDPPPSTAPQDGIVNQPPEHLLLAAINLTGPDPRATVEALRSVVQGELTGQLDRLGDPTQAPGETGEIGFNLENPDPQLTVTIGFASTAYDKLAVPAPNRPADLRPMPWAALGDNPDDPASGDVVLQICADSALVAEHVLRRVERALHGQVQVVWAHTGVQRRPTKPGRASRHDGRAWIGFLDGTSNLAPRHAAEDYALTFVDPDAVGQYPALPASGQPGPYGNSNAPEFPSDLTPPPTHEPEWTRNGSYLVARVSQNDLQTWDGTPLTAQEQTIGRTKVTGVSLDLTGQEDAAPQTPPAFAQNQDLTQVELDAHIRKANPRGAGDDQRRIFRRGYPLYEGGDGTARRGLIFLCFARTIATQFEFITRAWLTNPNFPRPGAGIDRLRAFDQHVLAGGYYFIPPLQTPDQPWSWYIPAAGTP